MQAKKDETLSGFTGSGGLKFEVFAKWHNRPINWGTSIKKTKDGRQTTKDRGKWAGGR
jgi:hypothetical protein